MHTFGKYLFIIGLLFISNAAATAQKKGARVQKKVLAKNDSGQASISFNEILPSTAHLVFVDSIVVDRNKFIDYIPLSKDCGTIRPTAEVLKSNTGYSKSSFAYVNEFGDKCFYNDSTKNGHSELFTTEKLAGKWQRGRLVSEFGNDYEDVNYPYLMPDGITLYFSAKNKSNSLGGRDIYVTRLNTDSMTFYKPENLGLPYNSSANDYCCIIDDLNSIGWLVTDRHQAAGKVCIYTFIPSDDRWTEIQPNMPQKKLEAIARITKISDTWTDNKAVAEAKARVEKLQATDALATNGKGNISFVVNDKTTYTNSSQFKSATDKKMFDENETLKASLKKDYDELDSMRRKYSASSGSNKNVLRKSIVELENKCEKKEIKIKETEKRIRNAENLK